MSRLLLSLLVLLSLTCALWANDGHVVGEGGRVRFMSGEDANIRMEQEWVNIDVYLKNYTVNATFKFVNDADTEQTVEMGFPESGGGDGGGGLTPGFISFTSKVDNVPVVVERKLSRSKNRGDGDYQAFWVKKVTFQPRQTRWVQVAYTSPHGSMTAYPRDYFGYIFTGGNWKGVVTSSELLVTFHNPGIWLVQSYVVELKQEDNRLYQKWENWQAETGFFASFAPAMPGTLVKKEARSPAVQKHKAFLITNKGSSGVVERAPAGLVRQGVAYVKLDDVVWALGGYSVKPQRKVEQDWNGETNTVNLRVDNMEYTFTPDFAEMVVNNKLDDKHNTYMQELSGKVFLIDDPDKKGEKLMYVPPAELVKALKGKYEENLEYSTIDYSF